MREKECIVLIIYDIVDNKKRNKMVKCLERYGVRVQKSAFEALLGRKKYFLNDSPKGDGNFCYMSFL